MTFVVFVVDITTKTTKAHKEGAEELCTAQQLRTLGQRRPANPLISLTPTVGTPFANLPPVLPDEDRRASNDGGRRSGRS